MTTTTTLTLSNMKVLTIPGPSYSGPRSALVEYSGSLSSTDKSVFRDYLSSEDPHAIHNFKASFPLNAFGGAKDITIIVREQLSVVKSTRASIQGDSAILSGYYDLTNHGEENSLLVKETNAFARVVFQPETRSIQFELPGYHTQTFWTLTEEPKN